jgi:hypothetical protein
VLLSPNTRENESQILLALRLLSSTENRGEEEEVEEVEEEEEEEEEGSSPVVSHPVSRIRLSVGTMRELVCFPLLPWLASPIICPDDDEDIDEEYVPLSFVVLVDPSDE